MKLLTKLIIPLVIVATSCQSPQPRDIKYDSEQCTECMMGITDTKFGAEIVTKTSKVFVFDAPECMLNWAADPKNIDANEVHSYWVTDFIHPEQLIDATTACYLQSEMVRSPMGLNVAAFSDTNSCERARVSFPGAILTFSEVSKKAVSR